jgi:hypothetical protein
MDGGTEAWQQAGQQLGGGWQAGQGISSVGRYSNRNCCQQLCTAAVESRCPVCVQCSASPSPAQWQQTAGDKAGDGMVLMPVTFLVAMLQGCYDCLLALIQQVVCCSCCLCRGRHLNFVAPLCSVADLHCCYACYSMALVAVLCGGGGGAAAAADTGV